MRNDRLIKNTDKKDIPKEESDGGSFKYYPNIHLTEVNKIIKNHQGRLCPAGI
jgi:hypothetical protein